MLLVPLEHDCFNFCFACYSSPFDWLDEGTPGFIASVIANNVKFKRSVRDDFYCVVRMKVDLEFEVGCVRLKKPIGIIPRRLGWDLC